MFMKELRPVGIYVVMITDNTCINYILINIITEYFTNAFRKS